MHTGNRKRSQLQFSAATKPAEMEPGRLHWARKITGAALVSAIAPDVHASRHDRGGEPHEGQVPLGGGNPPSDSDGYHE